MFSCSHCGMDLLPHEVQSGNVCMFCTSFGDTGFPEEQEQQGYPKYEPAGNLAQEVISALNYAYQNNPPQEESRRPSQIQIHKDDVNDVIKMNGFVKDILDVAAKQFPRNSAEAGAINTLFGQINTFTEGILEKAKKMEAGLRTAPILFSKMESEAYYKILDLAHKLYGKFMISWFRTKSKKDWPEWRKIFYENAWHLGSFCRYGRPAKSPSPWLTGERAPLEDDPMGDTPIGRNI